MRIGALLLSLLLAILPVEYGLVLIAVFADSLVTKPDERRDAPISENLDSVLKAFPSLLDTSMS
jgi:hypothetical protein